MWLLWLLMALMIIIMLSIILLPLMRSNKLPWFSTVFILLAVPLVSIPLYLHWGNSQQLAATWQRQENMQQVKQFMAQFKDPQEVIAKLKQHLATAPNSEKGWYLLGRLYFTTGKFKRASHAFAKANQLKPDDTNIMLQYAQALFFYNKQSLTEEAQQLINNVLKREANNPMALNLLAINAYRQKQYRQAIAYWEKLLAVFPPQSDSGEIILKAIADAQQQLQQDNPKLTVNVSLAPALAKKIKASDVLFIYAKAVAGPPMPVAIKRFTAKDLPLQTKLTDKSTMLPSIHLSQFAKVRVFARLSSSGNAMPQNGDLIGESGIITLSEGDQHVQITINKRVS